MRFRFKPKKVKFAKTDFRTCFAWLPAKLNNGTWVWMERYRKYHAFFYNNADYNDAIRPENQSVMIDDRAREHKTVDHRQLARTSR